MTPFGHTFLSFLRHAGPEGRLRLAPTPSGYLHPGNAGNFLLNWVVARSHTGARLLLRIDDLDAERKRPEFLQDIFETLEWLGLDWDEGPVGPDDFEENWSQHHRLPMYVAALNSLREKGLLFPCVKSRRDLSPYLGHYPIEFRHQSLDFDDLEVAWRIKTPRTWESAGMEDFIVRRRDGLPAYQLASLVDDRHFGITHIVRGEDLQTSTAAQQFLAQCLGWHDFDAVSFLHHPLLLDTDGWKLSKSAGATALRTWRESGRSPAELFKTVVHWLGLPPAPLASAKELLDYVNDVQIA